MNSNLQSHTVSSYDSELKGITKSLKEMGNLVGEILAVFDQALLGQVENVTLDNVTSEVSAIDKKINTLNDDVGSKAVNIIALRNPLAVDLRFVISAIKIATILERIGDIAKSSAKNIAKHNADVTKKYAEELQEMYSLVMKRINNSVKGFGKFDTEKADKVWSKEDKVDNLAESLFDKLKNDMSNKSSVAEAMSLLLVVKNLERMGDYTTNVTKMVHYVSSGEKWSDDSSSSKPKKIS